MATTVVTGATGFVGTNLVRRLVERGEQVRILARKTSNLEFLRDLGLEIVQGDIRDKESLRAAFQGCTRLYHVAGYVNLNAFKREKALGINVEGTDNVCRAALEAGIERMVHTSSVAACALLPPPRLVNEDTPWNAGRYHLPYLDTKRQGEAIALSYNNRGLPVVMVNPSYMFGPYDTAPTSGALLIAAARGQLRASLAGGLNIVDVEDVAEGHILAMEKGRPGQRYILGNQNVTYHELVTMLNEFMGRKPPAFVIPPAVAIGAGLLGTLLGTYTPIEPVLTLPLMRYLQHTQFLDCAKAITELGYPQTPMTVSIEKSYRWFVDHGYLKE